MSIISIDSEYARCDPPNTPTDDDFEARLAVAISHDNQLIRAVADPFRYGYGGRITTTPETSNTRIEADLRVDDWLAAKHEDAMPDDMRIMYLFSHGYYTIAELMKHFDFAKHKQGSRISREIEEAKASERAAGILERIDRLTKLGKRPETEGVARAKAAFEAELEDAAHAIYESVEKTLAELEKEVHASVESSRNEDYMKTLTLVATMQELLGELTGKLGPKRRGRMPQYMQAYKLFALRPTRKEGNDMLQIIIEDMELELRQGESWKSGLLTYWLGKRLSPHK